MWRNLGSSRDRLARSPVGTTAKPAARSPQPKPSAAPAAKAFADGAAVEGDGAVDAADAANADGSPIDEMGSTPENVAEVAARGTQGASGALPHGDEIQQSFGRHDLSGVRAHVGGEAAASSEALGANAYATGNAVAFASAPDLHTAAHEAAHVVQQQGGVQLAGGIDGGANDPGERHADAVADAVVAGKSAESLLDSHVGRGGGGGGGAAAVQRDTKDDTKGKAKDKTADDDVALPDHVNYAMRDGKVAVRTSWCMSDPGYKQGGDGTYMPDRMAAMLKAFKSAGMYSWMIDARIPEYAKILHVNPGIDEKRQTNLVQMTQSIYALIGPPPDREVLVIRNADNSLTAIMRTVSAVKTPVKADTEVEMTPEVRQKLWTAVESFTGMPFTPTVKNDLVNGAEAWKPSVGANQDGIMMPISAEVLERRYGKVAWAGYLKKPLPQDNGPVGASVVAGGVEFSSQISEEDRTYFLEWMKQLGGDGTPPKTTHTITSDVVKLMHDIDKNPLKEQILAKMREKGQGGKPSELDGNYLQSMINAAETDKMRHQLGVDTKKGDAYQPVFNWPVRGNIINRGGASYIGQDTQFYFETTHQVDAFAVPQVQVQWGVFDSKAPDKILKSGNTSHMELGEPDYFSYAWPATGTYIVRAVVTHSFYQPSHFEIPVQVKTEAERMQELNDKSFKGLQGKTTFQSDDHPFDVSVFNTTFGSHKEEYGKASWGEVDKDHKDLSFGDRTKFVDTDIANLEAFIKAHDKPDDVKNKDMVAYAKEQLSKQHELNRSLSVEMMIGNVFFDARGSFLSRQNGVRDSQLKLLASSKKDGDTYKVTIHDLTQAYEPQNYEFTGTGKTWDAAAEEAFVKMCKSYPPGRVAAMFQKVDDNGQLTKETRSFEFDTGTAWKDVKSVVYNEKVKMAVNIIGACTMIFLPFTAPFMLPILAAYNSIDTIDNMAQLREKGNLTSVEIAKGVAEIGMNFLPYVGELKPVASAGKVALYTLDGFTIGGQALLMTSEAVSQMRRIRDSDVQKVADKEAEIKELERTNPSSPELDRLRNEEKDLIEQTRKDAEAQLNNLGSSFAIMGMQVAGMHALSAHVSARNVKAAETDGIFVHHDGVEPHYDPATAEIKGDRAKLDGGKLAQLQKQYELDIASKQTELKNVLGTDKVEVVRTSEAKPKIVKDGDGYKVEIPKNKPFQSGVDEALRYERANGAAKPTPRATPERELTPDQQKLVAKNVTNKKPGAMPGDTVDNAYLTDEQVDIERWQTHALNDEATDVSAKSHAAANKMATNPEFRHWYDVWMSMPDRVTIEPDGHSKVNVPHGCPADIAEGIKAIGEKGNVGLMTRALDVSKRIEAEFPGLDADPNSTAWKQARPKLVEMLGEAEVKKYETERGGQQTEQQRQVMHDRLDELLAPGELAHITELVPGAKVFVTGSAAQTNKAVASVTDLDLIIVVPRNTPQVQRVELEQRIQSMKVRRPAQGGTPGAEMAVDGKVMTDDQFMGLSMSKTADGRTPLANFRVDEPIGGSVPGTGASGGDLHNHVMGVPATQYFVDKVGGGSSTVTLEKLFKDVHELEVAHQQNPQQTKPPVTADVSAQIKQGYAEVENAKAAGMAPDVVEARARRTLDNVLAANERTPFDATYDVRDLMVSKHIDKGSKGFENFAHDVITDLHDQGVTYSEQSVSQKKLETKFTPEAMKAAHDKAAAEGKDSDMKFLVMAPTSETLSAKAKPSPEAVKAADTKLEKSLMRPDVNGMDVAGPEAQPFTKAGMDWFVDRYKMLDRVAKQKGERMVLRPHVGEGYDPAGTGEHVKIAQDNLRMLTKTLKELGYNGSGDVIVRLGHATHATPEILQDMAATGIIVEANVGSNLATGSVLTAEQHPLLQNMYYNVKTILATDGQGVMSTTLPAEYQRAGLLIDRFKSGTPLEIDGKQVTWNTLDAATQKRFSLDWLQQQLAEYRTKQSTPLARP